MQKPFVYLSTFFCSSQMQFPPAQTATCAKFGLCFTDMNWRGNLFPFVVACWTIEQDPTLGAFELLHCSFLIGHGSCNLKSPH